MTRCASILSRSRLAATHACLIAVIFISGMGCGKRVAAPLRIAAASDLNAALPKLAERFRSVTGVESMMTFGASGQLAEQIKQGAPFDVFLSANQDFVKELARGGLITPETVVSYARGSLVLAVYQGQEPQVRVLGDLARPEVKKIALANPATAPYGKAARQALERAGLWKELEPKIVISESVRQALLYAQTGDADAALVGRAIADVPEISIVNVDPGLYDPIIQALGVIAASKRLADAQKFAQFVVGEEGQSVLKAYGFMPPDIAVRSQSGGSSRPEAQPTSSSP